MAIAPLSLVVLVSGNGSNLQALIDAVADGRLIAKIQLVVSNRPEAGALDRAKQSNIPTLALDHRQYSDRDVFDREMAQHIDTYKPDLVVLAGFMRLLTNAFAQHYSGKLINIHPSLLPKHKGLHTHQRAIEAGDSWHGASVHFVVPELDAGPCLAQVKIPILKFDTPETLAKRLLVQEHQLYPFALNLIAKGEIRIEDGQLFWDGKLLESPLEMAPIAEK